jgi:hypothetical protein
MLRHFADKEAKFVVVNVTPDFCRVDGSVTAFDIKQELSSERANYSPDVFSRGGKVLHVGSIIRGVVGNAGEGVGSTVSQETGDVITTEGSKLLFVNGKGACHHGHEVLMNVKT